MQMSDKQAQQNALRAQRAYESYERESRRKEKEAAEKQARMEAEIREERYKQQKAREHAIAIEAQKMKHEFYENLERQKEVEKKYKEEAEQERVKNKLYSLEVQVYYFSLELWMLLTKDITPKQAQIKEKEILRRKSRDDFFLEGIRLAKDRYEKKSKIDQIKTRKIQELRAMGVPSKYCNEIERQVHTTNKHFFSMGSK